MGFFLPYEVPGQHRRAAWALFVFLALGYIAYVATAIVLAVRSRRHPPVSIEYGIRDVEYPSIFVCPVVTANFYPQDHVQLRGLGVGCATTMKQRGAAYFAGPDTIIKSGSKAPLNWNLTRCKEADFQHNYDSDCEVTTVLDQNEDGIQVLCFAFHTERFTIKARTIREDLENFNLQVGWGYASTLLGTETVLGNSTFERKAFIVASYDKEKPLQNKISSWTIPTGLSTSLILSLTTREYLNGTLETLGSWGSSSFPLSFQDAYPDFDFVQVSLGLDRRGTMYVKEKNPINVTVLLSQVFAAWGFATFVFGLIFVKEEVRMYVLSRQARAKARQATLELIKSVKKPRSDTRSDLEENESLPGRAASYSSSQSFPPPQSEGWWNGGSREPPYGSNVPSPRVVAGGQVRVPYSGELVRGANGGAPPIRTPASPPPVQQGPADLYPNNGGY